MTDNAPGWQSDPTGRFEHRYWDGSQWTDNVADAGVASTDPFEASGPGLDETAAEAPVADGTAAPSDAAWEAPTEESQPVAPGDTTAAWPTSPPPPAYTPPAAATGPDEPAGGGSKRGLLIGGGILAVVLLAIGAFLLLGGDDEDDEVRTEAIAQLRELGLSEDDAECMADGLIDELGADALDGADMSSEPTEEQLAAFVETTEECDIDPSAVTGGDADDRSDDDSDDSDSDSDGDGTYGSDPELDALYDACEGGDFEACDQLYLDSPSGSEYEEFADSCGNRNEPAGYCVDVHGDGDGDDSDASDLGEVPDDFSSVFEGMGLSDEQSECLVEKFTELGDEIDEEAAMSAMFDFFEECDIDPAELGSN
jgi:hypothetical protein